METTVKERLIKYLESKRISKAEFARIIGVSSSYIAAMRKSIQPDKVAKISASFPDLNIQWLMTGEGTMIQNNQSIGNGASGVVITGQNRLNNSTINQDNRRYYSDSPDVLRAQIDLLDERIKEKDAQIKEKDAQIKQLLDILAKK